MHIHTSIRSASIALAMAATFALTPAATAADSAGMEYGLGVGCGLVHRVYGPVKILYATGGAIVSGFAWVFSAGDTDVAKPIWDASMRGDYMVGPDQLRGRRGIEFIGRAPRQGGSMDASWEQPSRDEGF